LPKGCVDPGNIKKAQKAAETEETETFEVIARERCSKFSPSWAVSHSNKIIRRFELYVFPWLGNKPIKSVTAPDLLKVLRRIEAKGTLETAHRTQQNCGHPLKGPLSMNKLPRPRKRVIFFLAKVELSI
jgi:integrase